MPTRDIFTDLANLAVALPDPLGASASDDQRDVWEEWLSEAQQERERIAEFLRNSWENSDDEDFDPLLHQLALARQEINAAEHKLRLLLTYGREFVEPRPYTLNALAEASGMSISGVRTAYDDAEIVEVAKAIGAKLRRRPITDDTTSEE